MTVARAVVVRCVTRRYGPTWVLRGVDASFEAGSLTVVEGANGAGKSTLLGIVGGLIQPTAGSVVWEPDGVGVSVQRHRIGWVGHESSSYRELTGEENVALVAAAHGVARDSVRQCLERVGVLDVSNRRVGTLSRGQKQRIALARGVVHAPALLLLDEPFTGLDVRGAVMLESVLLQERGRGGIVVVVSHDPDLARRLGARTIRLERGRVTSGEGTSGFRGAVPSDCGR